MTPEEDRLTRQGLALVLAHFEGDQQQRDQIFGSGLDDTRAVPGGDLFPIADAIAYTAVLGASMLAQVTRQSLETVLNALPVVHLRLLPDPAGIPWEEALNLVAAIPQSNAAARRVSRAMDVPSAPNGLFSVSVSAWTELARTTNRSAVELLRGALDTPPQH